MQFGRSLKKGREPGNLCRGAQGVPTNKPEHPGKKESSSNDLENPSNIYQFSRHHSFYLVISFYGLEYVFSRTFQKLSRIIFSLSKA